MHEIESLAVEIRDLLGKVLSRPTRERRLVIRQLCDAGPSALVGRAEYPNIIRSAHTVSLKSHVEST